MSPQMTYDVMYFGLGMASLFRSQRSAIQTVEKIGVIFGNCFVLLSLLYIRPHLSMSSKLPMHF